MSYLRSCISAALLLCYTALQTTLAHAGTDVGITSVGFTGSTVARANEVLLPRVDIQNLGTTEVHDVWVTATLPAGADYAGGGAGGSDVVFSGMDRLVSAGKGTLAPGETWYINLNLYPFATSGMLTVHYEVGLSTADDNAANDSADAHIPVEPPPSYLPDISVTWLSPKKAPRSTMTVVPWETSYHVKGALRVKNLLPYETPSTGSLLLMLSKDDTVGYDDLYLDYFQLGAIKPGKSLKLKVDASTLVDPTGYRILIVNRDTDRNPIDNRALSLPIVSSKHH